MDNVLDIELLAKQKNPEYIATEVVVVLSIILLILLLFVVGFLFWRPVMDGFQWIRERISGKRQVHGYEAI